MLKLLLTGWFLVKCFSIDGDFFCYYLHDSKRNIHISIRSETELSMTSNEYVKANIPVECQQIKTLNELNKSEWGYFCNAKTATIIKPTNCFMVNGMCYY